MPSEKYLRRVAAQRSRNLDNLRVIPTSSNSNNKLSKQKQTFDPPSAPSPPIPPAALPQTSAMREEIYQPEPLIEDYNKIINRKKQKRRRFRRQKRLAVMQMEMENNSYHWYNPSYMSNVNLHQNIYKKKSKKNFYPLKKTPKNIEKESGASAEEGYFEEVEAVSFENENTREIPVSFRKSKVHYLSYKENCFFKPKIYNMGKERIVVSCVNAQNDNSDEGDIDVISEAEYEVDAETEKSNKAESPDNLIEIVDLEDDEVETNISEPKEKLTSKDNNMDISKSNNKLSEKSKNISEPNKLSEKNNQHISKLNKKLPMDDKLQETDKTKTPTCVVEVIDLDDESQDNYSSCDNQLPKEKRCPSAFRIYKTCIEDTADLHQGKSLHQNSLDSWKSHLIGLEYIVEVQNQAVDCVLKYYCALCDEDLIIEEFPAICVINHINSNNHIVKYLENHFPSCGYRYAENSDIHNSVILNKVCEEINRSAGYYYMCITNLDSFIKSKQVMQELILNAKHVVEDSVNVNDLLKNTLETVILNDVKDVLNDVIVEISSSKKFINPKPDSKMLSSKNAKDKKIRQIQRSSAVSSYLKLKFASSKSKQPKKDDLTASKLVEKGFEAKDDKIDNSKNVPKISAQKVPVQKNTIVNTKSITQITQKDSIKIDNSKSANQQNESVKEASKINKGKSANQSTQNDCVKVVNEGKSNIFRRSSAVSSYLKLRFASDKRKKLSAEKPAASKLIVQCDKSGNLGTDAVSKVVPDTVNVVEDQRQINSSNSETLIKKDTAKKGNSETVLKATQLVEMNVTSKKVPKVVKPIHRRLVLRGTEKIVLNPALHSKHCRKRILGKAISRLRVAAKTSSTEPIVNISLNESTKDVSEESIHSSSDSKPVVHIKKWSMLKKGELKQVFAKSPIKSSSTLKSPLRKIIPIKKTTVVGSESSKEFHSKSHNIIDYESEGDVSQTPVLIKKQLSPFEKHSRTLGYRKRARTIAYRKRSRSPYKRTVRRQSKSPIRHVIRSPIRVTSPISWRRHSRSPVRKRRRTPVRKQSRSPVKRRSRSPAQRYSRSPVRKHARSPVRRLSRSPHRKHSRSPCRRGSRSPGRRGSRSPNRRHSRSPNRRHSRSPNRRHSRSPVRRHSRSPIRRLSRSPVRRHSRSPGRRYSRSPVRRVSRSPIRRMSKSPVRRRSRSPHISGSLLRYRGHSPSFVHSKIIDDDLGFHGRFASSKKSFAPGSSREVDLDPVSDEDESVYFNTSDKLFHADNKMSLSASMFEKFLKKFTTIDTNPNNVGMNKFMQFMESHSAELREMVGPEFDFKSSNISSAKIDANVEERNLLLQQYMLSNMAENIQHPAVHKAHFPPNVPNVPHPFISHPFVPNHPPPTFGHVPHMPTPDQLQPGINQPKIFPPNLNMPPPERFQQSGPLHQGMPPPTPVVPPRRQFNQPHQPSQNLPLRPKVPPEIMFKDLKATVNKLFGANESFRKNEESKPNASNNFLIQANPEKWGMSHSGAPKFNVSSGPKNVFQSPEKKFQAIPGICEDDDMTMAFNSGGGQFFSSRGNIDRPQLPIPPPNAKVSFCDAPSQSSKGNLFPVINNSAQGSSNMNSQSARGSVSDVKVSLAQRLASVLVKVGMIDVPAPLLQEMLMKIGAFSSSPPQEDIREAEIVSILKRLGYLS